MQLIAPISTHWVLFVLYAVLILGMTGVIGSGMGLQNIFHEDAELIGRYRDRDRSRIYWNSPAIFGQASAVAFLVLIWGFAYTLGNDAGGAPERMSMGTTVALQILFSAPISLAAGAFRLTRAVGPLQEGEWWRCLIGAAIGVIGAFAILGAGFVVSEAILAACPTAGRWAPTVGLAVPSLAVVMVVLGYRKLLPVMALVCLLALLAILYALISVVPGYLQLFAIAAAAIVIVLANGWLAQLVGLEAPLKFEIPGIVDSNGDSHYRRGRRFDLTAADGAAPPGLTGLDALRVWTQRAEKVKSRRALTADGTPAPREGMVDPLAALEAWHARVSAHQGDKPKLVLVATSGGAYRASFWTALVLDRLFGLDGAGELAGFRDNIRLITGASGGMVAGGYLAALADVQGTAPASIVAAMERDILAAQDLGGTAVPGYPYPTRYPIPRDSLSAVAQQLVQRDIPGLLWPFPQRTDRGTVLEDQWTSLDRPFSALMAGEAAGWRPSIVFSPMLVETGQPLLIGNLDMEQIREDIYGETVAFFDWFPGSRDHFKVKTAVRLNASFPYVAPAAALPTRPYRRVVDAGYYDNYGVDIAVAYLSRPRLRDWIIANCSGVALIEIRAFPFPLPEDERPGWLARGFQWLTTPLEGLLIARGSTMRFHNRQGVRRLRDAYREITGRDFVVNTIFEVSSKTSMSWYLPGRELDEMRAALDHPVNADATQRLLGFWSQP